MENTVVVRPKQTFEFPDGDVSRFVLGRCDVISRSEAEVLCGKSLIDIIAAAPGGLSMYLRSVAFVEVDKTHVRLTLDDVESPEFTKRDCVNQAISWLASEYGLPSTETEKRLGPAPLRRLLDPEPVFGVGSREMYKIQVWWEQFPALRERLVSMCRSESPDDRAHGKVAVRELSDFISACDTDNQIVEKIQEMLKDGALISAMEECGIEVAGR